MSRHRWADALEISDLIVDIDAHGRRRPVKTEPVAAALRATGDRWGARMVEQLPATMTLADRFIDAIAPVVWDLYPTSFVDDEGNHLRAEDETVEFQQAMVESKIERNPLDDAFDAMTRSPFLSMFDEDEQTEPKVEYDLDGNPIVPIEEDPWRDVPGGNPFPPRLL